MLSANLLEVDPNKNERISVLVNSNLKRAIEYCGQKLEFENASMVIRRALLNYLKDNLTEHEYMEFIRNS